MVFFDQPRVIVILGLVVGTSTVILSGRTGRLADRAVKTVQKPAFDTETKVAMHFVVMAFAVVMAGYLALGWNDYRYYYRFSIYAVRQLYAPAFAIGFIIGGYFNYFRRKR